MSWQSPEVGEQRCVDGGCGQKHVDSGIPTLTEAGMKALEEEMKEEAAHPLEQ